ncbi:unnamed protein product [Oreochromis niloticus]|nr:unnamed protein product [Mustela putorius furo]
MAVEQLRSWQHDIAERCTHLTESIFDRYMDEDEALDTTDMMEIQNHVHRLRALVEYSLQDQVRAKVLLSAVRDTHPHLYKDLLDLGPRGKTGTVFLFVAITIVFDKYLVSYIHVYISAERKLTQFKLTHAAERALGSTLPTFHRAVRDGSFLDNITRVDAAVDIMVQEELILPNEQYMLYHINKTTAGKVRAIRCLFRCPTVPDEAKASIALILAVYNLHAFGIFTNDPDGLLETV